jgi:hypothetical protein
MTTHSNPYTLAWILPFVRHAMRGKKAHEPLVFVDYANDVWTVLESAKNPDVYRNPPSRGFDASLFEFGRSPRDLKLVATEAFNYLVSAGLLMAIPDGHSGGFFTVPGSYAMEGFFVTERGANWAAAVEPVPEDSAFYMNHLSHLVPTLDPVIAEYISEGLSAFVRGNDFSAAVMVGAASEKAIYLVANSLLLALSDPAKNRKLQDLLETRGLKRLFDYVRSLITDGIQRKVIPYSVHEGADTHIMSLIEAVRVQRNDAVHPENAKVTPDSVRLSYQAFPAALKKIEELRAWCAKNRGAL